MEGHKINKQIVTVQRHRHNGNLKVSVTDLPTNGLTGIGARDTFTRVFVTYGRFTLVHMEPKCVWGLRPSVYTG